MTKAICMALICLTFLAPLKAKANEECLINDAECFRDKYVTETFRREMAENKARLLQKENRELAVWGEHESWRAATAEEQLRNKEKPNPYFWYSAGIISGVAICMIVGLKMSK